jgi:hypothetical protein
MLFSGLPPAGLAAIIDSMQPQMATAGKDVIKQVGLPAGAALVRGCWSCLCLRQAQVAASLGDIWCSGLKAPSDSELCR